jgi:hypothetical protein
MYWRMRTANQHLKRRGRESGLAGIGRLGGCVVAAALVAAGCAHSRNKDRIGFIPPPVPLFLNGPMGVLLTNTTGFSCHVVMTTGSPPIPGETISGQLLCRGSQLLFAPDADSPSGKRFKRCGFIFIWEVGAQRGYLLSEALQGYAPISSRVQATNILALASRSASEGIGGHRCQRTEVEVETNDGSKAPFQVWRASDLNAAPLRIATAAPGRPVIVNFSKIRLGAPSSRLFLPPDGFTAHDSAETMMGEMAMRQENLKRKSAEEQPTEFQAQPRMEAR